MQPHSLAFLAYLSASLPDPDDYPGGTYVSNASTGFTWGTAGRRLQPESDPQAIRFYKVAVRDPSRPTGFRSQWMFTGAVLMDIDQPYWPLCGDPNSLAPGR